MTTKSDDAWRRLISLVVDSRGDWRRSITESTGLPFAQFRALRRLDGGPLTLVALAYAMSVDAPAATVAVNNLERRGLVVRAAHPTNKRAKLVELTAAGRRVLETGLSVGDQPPAGLARLDARALAQLTQLLDQIDGRSSPTESAAKMTPHA